MKLNVQRALCNHWLDKASS